MSGAAPAAGPLDHIPEGHAFKDGQSRQLYDPADNDTARSTFFKKCLDFNFGVLSLHTCLDLDGPSASLEATLLGVSLAECEISRAHDSCRIGGSVDGFKAQVTVTLVETPLSLDIEAQLCAPIAGCDTFHTTIPL